MSKSIAEMRQSPQAALAERTYKICLSQKLVAEVHALVEEKSDLIMQAAGKRPKDDESDSKDAPPRKMAQGGAASPRVAEIDARLEELYEEMREHTGEIRLRAIDPGEWMLWTRAHPAREDNDLDEQIAYGLCNAEDLLAALGDYVVAWNSDKLGEGDWAFIRSKSPVGDLKEMAKIVVQLHEGKGAVPKSRPASSAEQTSATA